MKSTVTYFQALLAFAIAGPLDPRQGIDTSLVDTAPTPTSASIPIGPTIDSTTYNLSQATESATESPLPVETEPTTLQELAARQTACQPLPTGAGPVPSPDTASAFLADTAFRAIASQAPVPSGYNATFINLQVRAAAYSYLGFIVVDSYDTVRCAEECDNVWRGCQGFNIFFERDPIVAPARGCADPPSTTNIKCVFWGGDVSGETAINNGTTLVDFQVVVTGSNGYTRNTVPTVPGYDGEPTGNNTIDAPPEDTTGTVTVTTITSATTTVTTTVTPTNRPGGGGRGGRGGTYIGSKIFTNTFFDPGLCAAACDAQNRNNLANPPARGQPQICRFFTTYLIYRNGQPIGQYCALYTQYYPRRFATVGSVDSGGDTLDVRHAFSYRNTRAPNV
ncbi:hypothetical protein F4677DRAFT_456526 [Hypoxylon crocopeplum]|nr:hypothetical protein F4677DRAFT_456526 [Hypoxylon crocopeplum]